VAATGYGPLIAELLELLGCTGKSENATPEEIEEMLHRALFTAEATHDDVTAAKAATDLIWVAGVSLDRPREAEMWFRLSESMIDRLGPGHERIRAWALNNLAGVLNLTGELDRATRLARQAVALKEQVLGRDHPDVAISLNALSSILEENGEAVEALECADRAIAILKKNGDPESEIIGSAQKLRGDSLVALGRGTEAEAAFEAALPIYRRYAGRSNRTVSYPLQGIGDAKLLQGKATEAIPILEETLRIREAHEPFVYAVAQTRFSLAQAMWDSGADRKRALRLAHAAEKTFTMRFPRRERAIVQWLAEHRLPAR
jgi:tetratricopeptide (TPR) repeat protein